ncbi:hypothetical protein RF11_02492 [Thelohanellus kitauei]|uniref:Uncharacterized protein n=1 Tax=Thelohanellus kitauei TaxID=669202 RepID=A0A0C2IZX0_THEKT|nr:hypothetical protein RF11_02492 [Thelohanellus kitauei]
MLVGSLLIFWVFICRVQLPWAEDFIKNYNKEPAPCYQEYLDKMRGIVKAIRKGKLNKRDDIYFLCVLQTTDKELWHDFTVEPIQECCVFKGNSEECKNTADIMLSCLIWLTKNMSELDRAALRIYIDLQRNELLNKKDIVWTDDTKNEIE